MLNPDSRQRKSDKRFSFFFSRLKSSYYQFNSFTMYKVPYNESGVLLQNISSSYRQHSEDCCHIKPISFSGFKHTDSDRRDVDLLTFGSLNSISFLFCDLWSVWPRTIGTTLTRSCMIQTLPFDRVILHFNSAFAFLYVIFFIGFRYYYCRTAFPLRFTGLQTGRLIEFVVILWKKSKTFALP